MDNKKFETALTVERVAKYFVVAKKKVVADIADHTISLFPNSRNKRLIDFSEANRVYDLRPEYADKFSNRDETDAGTVSKDAKVEDVVEREKLVVRNEALTEMLEARKIEVEFLKKELSKSSNLLSDQRAHADKEAERRMREQKQFEAFSESLEKMEQKNSEQIEQLKKQNRTIRLELRESQKSLWTKIFGSNNARRLTGETRKQSAR